MKLPNLSENIRKLKSLLKTKDFWIQTAASIFTLAGVGLGTTTPYGSVIYFISCWFWVWIMVRGKLWGLAPFNVVVIIITIGNIFRAFS